MRVIDREAFDRAVESFPDESLKRRLRAIARNKKLERNPPKNLAEVFDYYRKEKTPATYTEIYINGCRQTEEVWTYVLNKNLDIIQEIVGDDLQRAMQLMENPNDGRIFFLKSGGFHGYCARKKLCRPKIDTKHGGFFGGIVCYCDERLPD